MLNIIVIVATAMGIVAFGWLASSSAHFINGYVALLPIYTLFASGVGFGICIIALWNALVEEWFDRGEA